VSSAGVQTVDLNNDGYPEIIIHNHLKDGQHTINTWIYWNGPRGFDRSRRSELPTFGPHFSQMTDAGNLFTRKLEEEYLSPPIELPAGRRAARLSWASEEPPRTKLRFQLRGAATRDDLARAPWQGPSGENSSYDAPGAAVAGAGAGRWVQYRALFTSVNGGEYPVLKSVEIGIGK
jgi:hypothetical protein